MAGPYLAKFPTRRDFSKQTGTIDGLESAWRAFGWDLIGLNTEWQGADPYVQGFACNPQAIGVICGVPLTTAGRQQRDSNRQARTCPAWTWPLQTNLWMDANARTMRATYDLMLGAALVDASAGVIIKSQ